MAILENLISAGATLDFRDTVDGFAASDGWTLKYRLTPRDSAGTAIDITAAADGDGYRVSVAKSTTQSWAAGYYTVTRWVEKATELYEVGAREIVEIRARPDTLAAGADGRSHAQKVLDAIKAVIEQRATIDQQEYSIQGRMLKRMPIADLLVFQDKYQRMVNNEIAQAKAAADSNFNPRMIGLRFTRP